MSKVSEMHKTDARSQQQNCEIGLTGWSVHLPNFEPNDAICGCESGSCCPPELAHELLGRKGLLFKEAATRLALCAVHRALNLVPSGCRPDGPPDPRTAVVASSNFGNCSTVHNIAKTLQRGGVRDVSALDAPNTSSNVIASTIAIWFRFGGPNLMVCSGATSGLDAIQLASVILRAGRADRVVVVGVEPDDDVARNLYRQRAAAGLLGSRLRAGAACVVLEAFATAPAGTPLLGPVRSGKGFMFGAHEAHPSVVIGPVDPQSCAPRVIDLVNLVGDTYGALGLLQVAIATSMITTTPANSRPFVGIVCGDVVDGWRSTTVREAPIRLNGLRKV